jgi:isopentenyl diphosphate isomerase/L-lactate dehydrogenase-like FMN-dependent dehydrogenase
LQIGHGDASFLFPRSYPNEAGMNPLRCHDIADLRAAARRRLPRGLFEYVDRGCDGETGLAANRAAFDFLRFAPRVLADVGERSLGATVLGRAQALPMAIAPMSPAGLLWFEGERELAEAAKAAGIPFTLATESMTSLETIAREVGGTLWFQLYIWRERALSWRLVERAARAGYQALLFTVDTPATPHRAFNDRSGYGTPFRPSPSNVADMVLHPRWLAGVIGRYALARGLPRLENHPGEPKRTVLHAAPAETRLNQSIAWEDVRTLRGMWPGKLIVKGVLRADDARRAIDCGADGVVVSNHGARNLDSACASIAALPAVAAAIGGDASVLLDSGVRYGTDIAKALALGAEAVLIGRPALFGIAMGGRAGAARAIALLAHEFDIALANLGCRSPAELSTEVIWQAPPAVIT